MSTNDTSGPTIANASNEQKPGVHRNVSVNRFQVLKLKLDSADLPTSSVDTAVNVQPKKAKIQKAASEPPSSLSMMMALERQNSAAGGFEWDFLNGIIIEVEAHTGKDSPACHAARVYNIRTSVIFGFDTIFL
ncbi:unnamed protein product [Onchocerca ochengi]|uniref:LSM14 domain-containing protein n=1 Tax=Onchocerca ochengi TaxID=42157 RepID=A0A182E5F3_ONCOC|nr:unnamed protein product [Onchocerca ochengi]